mmetsp:Transcript_84205/g.238588  ORF Transcript_84205/g.238588 Transcript_84205/m.238588 type:complete len:226 (-) Transcript_84205:46-723(-)
MVGQVLLHLFTIHDADGLLNCQKLVAPLFRPSLVASLLGGVLCLLARQPVLGGLQRLPGHLQLPLGLARALLRLRNLALARGDMLLGVLDAISQLLLEAGEEPHSLLFLLAELLQLRLRLLEHRLQRGSHCRALGLVLAVRAGGPGGGLQEVGRHGLAVSSDSTMSPGCHSQETVDGLTLARSEREVQAVGQGLPELPRHSEKVGPLRRGLLRGWLQAHDRERTL